MDNARARYSGVFGGMRSRRDERRLDKTIQGRTGLGSAFVRKIRSPEAAAAIAGTYASTAEGATSTSIANSMEVGYYTAGGADFDITDFIDY